MKRIAVLNDLSGLGKCSLTAAIPVISVMGVQACPLPTAVLSNQTGYASYYWDDYTDKMDAIMEEWKRREFQPDGIYTGFLAGARQADKILEFLDAFGKDGTLILTDPVMGDRGTVYKIYTEELCGKMREIVSRAHVITPNLTEALLLLYGKDGMETVWKELSSAAAQADFPGRIEEIGIELTERFQLKATVITGVDHQPSEAPLQMGNLIVENGKCSWIFAEKKGGSYSGTGDLFASVLSAGLVRGMSMEACVGKAVGFLSKAIADAVEEGTDRNDGVCFETYLHELWED
ncbi:MAG: pyridoxamine kinase [Eubacteriales bacterium]|nr:pyridoxamine kinase [Eubacteriales bacterium]